jgi:glutamine amidotransferase-like uncharacterized protein
MLLGFIALVVLGTGIQSTPAFGRTYKITSAIPESSFRKLPSTDSPQISNSLDQQGRALVGLYIDDGSWATGKQHMQLFMTKYGYSYQSFTAADIQSGKLQENGIRLLMMPGGESWTYLKKLGESGASQIRHFVSHGGSYFGVCAGAFYAVANRDGGAATGHYGIGLLDGTAFDGTAHEVEPFKEGMMDFDFFIEGFQRVFRIVLLGGPSFRFSEAEAVEKKIKVLAEYQKIREPAMILYNYGAGKVFLSGPHLEIEEPLTKWGKDYEDPESDWPIMDWVTQHLIGTAGLL